MTTRPKQPVYIPDEGPRPGPREPGKQTYAPFTGRHCQTFAQGRAPRVAVLERSGWDPLKMVVTFDVFSALIDSRAGGTAFFADLGSARSWAVPASQVYDQWDVENKALHHECTEWVHFGGLAERALSRVYQDVGVTGDAAEDGTALLTSMREWPLWPDVSAESFAGLEAQNFGLLTNIDNALLEPTAVMRLGIFDPERIFTSEKARAYKPSTTFYRRAQEAMGPLLHVAASARDVRGTLEAGIPCVRLVRTGHSVDSSGPQPRWVAHSFAELPNALQAATESL